jgi:FAD/FMN-containing dehydrogenase
MLNLTFTVLLLSASWADTASTKAVQDATRHVMSLLEACAEKKGLLLKFQYLNYAAAYQTPLESYGEENLNFLRGVSREYDPKGVFQKQIPGGFKLW